MTSGAGVRGIEGRDSGPELMERRLLADTRERFVERADALASPRVAHARLGHQVAFVAASAKIFAVKRVPFSMTMPVTRVPDFCDAALFAQAVAEEHADPGLLHQILEDRLGDVRLEVPLDRPVRTSCRPARRTRANSRR